MAEKKTRAVSRRAPAKKAVKASTKKSKSFSAAKTTKRKTVSAKKTTKETTRKAFKKASAKKVVKKKEVKAADLAKEKTGKLVGNKFLSSKNTTPKKESSKTKKETVSVATDYRVAVKDDTVTIFSRVRTDNKVMLVARVLGLVFVLTGVLFSISGVSKTMGDSKITQVFTSISALLPASVSTTQQYAETVVHVDEANVVISESEKVSDTKPHINISLPSNTDAALVPLHFTVSAAQKIAVSAFHKDSKVMYQLGQAKSSDSTLWKYQWDTSSFPGGEYRILVHVTNRFGAYLEKSDNYIRIIKKSTSQEDTTFAATSTQESDTTDVAAKPIILEQKGTTSVSQMSEATEKPIDASLAKPTSVITVQNTNNQVQGRVMVQASTKNADFAEFYARQKDSLKDLFLGLGIRDGEGSWNFVWDTTQTPNGTYRIIAKHRNPFGFYWSDSYEITVANTKVIPKTETTEKVIQTLTEVNEEVKNPISVFRNTLKENSAPDTVSTTTTITAPSDAISDNYASILRDHSLDIENAMQAYARALRTDDIVEQRIALKNIDTLKNTISIAGAEDEDEVIRDTAKLKTEIEGRFNRLTSDIVETQAILEKRIGDAATKDSDADGITDYDEVTFYKTNPFSADSDNDGFTDEAEILGGFNPTDDSQESAIVFESPKEAGVIREDIFVVENIVTEQPEDETVDGPKTAAIISGKALPNSFVTIYIFSTPVIVTVKTNDDGSWNYRFDKELEDGEHQVFVGVTDNAGKIVAKSNPFTFVKEAEAFSPVGAETSAGIVISEPQQPTLLNQDTLLVAAGAVVMALGFILLLLTLYFGRRHREETEVLAHAI